MRHREAHLISDRMITPDLRHGDLVVRTQPASHLGRARGHVQVERAPHLTQMDPLRHRLEMAERLLRFHLDDTMEPPATVGRGQHEVGIHHPGPDADGRGPFVAKVDGHGKAPA